MHELRNKLSSRGVNFFITDPAITPIIKIKTPKIFVLNFSQYKLNSWALIISYHFF